MAVTLYYRSCKCGWGEVCVGGCVCVCVCVCVEGGVFDISRGGVWLKLQDSIHIKAQVRKAYL